jgi:hypothetical protein
MAKPRSKSRLKKQFQRLVALPDLDRAKAVFQSRLASASGQSYVRRQI